MKTLLEIGGGEYTGSLIIIPVELPEGLSTVALQIECANWVDPTSNVLVTLEVSQDNCVTWQKWMSCKLYSGKRNKQGQPVPQLSATGKIPSVTAGMKLQGLIEITGTLKTSGISVLGS